MNYTDFLLSKVCIAPENGFNIDLPLLKFLDGTTLKPHQRDGVIWAIKGGRRALFESFGLVKIIPHIYFKYCDNFYIEEIRLIQIYKPLLNKIKYEFYTMD